MLFQHSVSIAQQQLMPFSNTTVYVNRINITTNVTKCTKLAIKIESHME